MAVFHELALIENAREFAVRALVLGMKDNLETDESKLVEIVEFEDLVL